jgi:hypothetical protein
MLQVFDIDVAKVDRDIAKVDRDVAHVAMKKYACCKPMFKCFRCFRRMLQMFYLDVSKVDLGIAHVAMAIHACFKYFICFRRMLQMFHLDVSKLIWCCTCCYGYTHMFEAHVLSVSFILDVCSKCFI